MTKKELMEENVRLTRILRHIMAEHTGEPFICGLTDHRDDEGFPDKLFLCIEYGADLLKVYKRVDKDEDDD